MAIYSILQIVTTMTIPNSNNKKTKTKTQN